MFADEKRFANKEHEIQFHKVDLKKINVVFFKKAKALFQRKI